jgi:hypothetical protein
MDGVDWFWLTVIILILSIKTGDILCYYWKCKYSPDKETKAKQVDIEEKSSPRKVITGFSTKQ